MYFFVTSTGFLVIVYFLSSWMGSWGLRYAHACTFMLDNMILYEKKISILIVIADLEGFIQTIRSYLCTFNSIAGIAT